MPHIYLKMLFVSRQLTSPRLSASNTFHLSKTTGNNLLLCVYTQCEEEILLDP